MSGILFFWVLHLQLHCSYATGHERNGIFYIIESCEYVEYFKIRFLMAKLLTDHNQTSVLRNEKWPGKLTKQTQ